MHDQLCDRVSNLTQRLKMGLSGYIRSVHFSRQSRIILAVLAGISLSVLVAGYFLSRRRRKYRAIPTAQTNSQIHRSGTFQQSDYDSTHNSPLHSWSTRRHRVKREISSGDSSMSEHPSDQQHYHLEHHHHQQQPVVVHEEHVDYDSTASSDDSFHSTTEYLGDRPLLESLDELQLYNSALDLVNQGVVKCRNIRTKMLQCHSDADFLAKVYCVRLAFDELVHSTAYREYFKQIGMDIMADFLKSAEKDPTRFCEGYSELINFMESDSNWLIAKQELTVRKVACMNIYDIALDFVLLDAFDDLDNPPSTMAAVFRNRWITSGMKRSALSAAIWSILKAKKGLLKRKDGFMYKFYVVSEALSPTLAWGFLGTDEQLRKKCKHFKDAIMSFTCGIFSFEVVRYTTIHTLAGDILKLSQHTADVMSRTEEYLQ